MGSESDKNCVSCLRLFALSACGRSYPPWSLVRVLALPPIVNTQLGSMAAAAPRLENTFAMATSFFTMSTPSSTIKRPTQIVTPREGPRHYRVSAR